MSYEARKLRRIHMDAASCAKFANSSEGLVPLTAPDAVKMANSEPKGGLYIRIKHNRASSSSSDGGYPLFSKSSRYYVKRKGCQFPSHVNTNDEVASVMSYSPDSKIHVDFSLSDSDDDLFRIRIKPAHERKKKEIPSQNKRTKYPLKTESSVCDIPVDYSKTTTSKGSPDPSVGEFSNIIRGVTSESCQGSPESAQLPLESNCSSESQKQEVPNYFGLFGATEADEYPEPDYFNQLPLEVKEHIFCQLPILDLQNCRLVCHLWNDVISRENFVHWKTTYYKLKYGCSSAGVAMGVLLASLEGNTAKHCLHALLRFMKADFTPAPAPGMLEKLKKHKKFDVAENVLKERFPDWNDTIISPWCFITTIILLSETVSDVFEIIHLLSYTVDVLEALYCNATFLLYCMNTLEINHGLHYRVYYTLYTLENHLPAEIGNSSVQSVQTSDQQTTPNCCSSLPLTCEQNSVVRHKLKRGDVIKVIGSAGSGKTSTLIELARRNPKLQFLNIMFNKSACDHAQKLFPSNVMCRTAHSLAYASIGKQFAHRLTSKFSSDIIKQHLDVSECPFATLSYCRAILTTIQNFMASDDMEISMKHVLEDMPITNVRMINCALTPNQKLVHSDLVLKYTTPAAMPHYPGFGAHRSTRVGHSATGQHQASVCLHAGPYCRTYRRMRRCGALLKMTGLRVTDPYQVYKSAVAVWNILIDRNEKCPVTHDVYLKLFQMSKPVIKQDDCIIMVDEAQNCNPVLLDIVLSQEVPVILVGDPHQQIYGFCGSKNALQDIKSTHTYHLTKSFRFGPEIAYVASCWLEVLKKCRRETLVGNSRPSTISGVVRGQYAIIARTNLGLFNEAIRLCCQELYKHEDEPRLIFGAFIGGLDTYDLDQIEDIYRLKTLSGDFQAAPRLVGSCMEFYERKPKEQPRDKFIKQFPSFHSLLTYAKGADDAELIFKIELCLQHGHKIPDYLATLRRKCSNNLELANVVFTTVDKAKGFEFDTVRLVDDYNLRSLDDIASQESEKECNAMYVALTRAKSSLFITEKLYKVLQLAQEKFEYPIPSKDIVVQDVVTQKCVLCSIQFQPHTVLNLVRRKVTLTNGKTLEQGPICIKCATAPYYKHKVVEAPAIVHLDPIKDLVHRSLHFLVGPPAF